MDGESSIMLRSATRFGWIAGLLGLACGVLYSVGGFFVDLFTIGLNWGTVLAFGALVGMPALFGAAGFVLGALLGLLRSALGNRR